jgi:hypothetical protein
MPKRQSQEPPTGVLVFVKLHVVFGKTKDVAHSYLGKAYLTIWAGKMGSLSAEIEILYLRFFAEARRACLGKLDHADVSCFQGLG